MSEHVARIENREKDRQWPENLKERDHLGEVGVDGRECTSERESPRKSVCGCKLV